jgi:hypothetical protein
MATDVKKMMNEYVSAGNPHINPADEVVEFLLSPIKVPATSQEMVRV